MKMTNLSKLTVALCLLLGVATLAVADDHPAASVGADAALARLKAGNARFVATPVSKGKSNTAKREETAKAQHPFAIIVACADSRTAPEIVFDGDLGDLFVVRTAGNLIDDHALGSIEYAVAHLGARLIVVLGHQRCGAVVAALASAAAPGHVQSLVRDIQPAVEAAKGKPGDATDNTVAENSRLIAARIGKEAELGDVAKEVRVVSAVYSFDTGKVEWQETK
jgi:carbonic anhydrase